METFPYTTHLAGNSGSTTLFNHLGHREGPFPRSNLAEWKAGSKSGIRFQEVESLSNCMYCDAHLQIERHTLSLNRQSVNESRKCYGLRCHACGWWFIREHYYLDDDLENVIENTIHIYEGVIATFRLESEGTVLRDLESELMMFRKSLQTITPPNVETLVGRILGNAYKCDVKHIGRSSADGGIDLLLLIGERTIPVQVKHRAIERKQKSEGVKPLREFAGAMIAHGKATEGIFVTTAPEYSGPAKAYAAEIRCQLPLNLMTVSEIREHLQLVASDQWSCYREVWASVRTKGK